jgi:hypothetical protein
MTPLEQRLEALGPELAFPPAPDLAPGVRARLRGRPFPWGRAALALALVVVALAAALAVPQARTALLRFFHVRGATVELVETLPPAGERRELGRRVSVDEAERQVGFRLLLPRLEDGRPKRAYVVGDSLATVVLHGYGTRVLLSEFPSFGGGAVKKLAAGEASVEPARVGPYAALWVRGPHTFAYFDRATGYSERPVRVRGNVLLWERNGLTLRLEGQLTRAQATGIAKSVR